MISMQSSGWLVLITVILHLCHGVQRLPHLPTNYSVAFAVGSGKNNKITIIEEVTCSEPLNTTGLQIWNEGISSNLILHRKTGDHILHDGKGGCAKSKLPVNTTVTNPLSLPDYFQQPIPVTMYDLWGFFSKSPNWTMRYDTSEGARMLEIYEGIVNLTRPYFANVTIIAFIPFSTVTVGDVRLLRFMSVTVCSRVGNEVKELVHLNYTFFESKTQLSTDLMESYFLPPEGVFCEGLPTDPLPAMDLKNFVASIDVLRHKEKLISDIRLMYSSDERIASFTNMNTSALAFNQGLNLTGSTLRVTQDFDHGLQFVVDSATSVCHGVQPIPPTSGLLKAVEVAGKNETVLTLKNATEALVNADTLSYGHLGQRTLDGMTLDVWVAQKKNNSNCVAVYEALFRKDVQLEDEKAHILTVNLPWALRVYNSCNPTAMKERTTYEFYNFVPFSAGFVPWNRYDVSPCLNYTSGDSYLMVVVNVTVDALSLAGIELVENFMRQSLAKIAGVSPLRISRFMFQPNGSGAMVLFQLANVTGVSGTHTEFYQPEKDVQAARRSLNQTLLNDYSVTVPSEKGRSLVFAILAGTLADAYQLCHGGGGGSVIVNYHGYSGGSMAGLGISMLLLGSFFGLIIGFYLWKRSRGIAYQMYE